MFWPNAINCRNNPAQNMIETLIKITFFNSPEILNILNNTNYSFVSFWIDANLISQRTFLIIEFCLPAYITAHFASRNFPNNLIQRFD